MDSNWDLLTRCGKTYLRAFLSQMDRLVQIKNIKEKNSKDRNVKSILEVVFIVWDESIDCLCVTFLTSVFCSIYLLYHSFPHL